VSKILWEGMKTHPNIYHGGGKEFMYEASHVGKTLSVNELSEKVVYHWVLTKDGFKFLNDVNIKHSSLLNIGEEVYAAGKAIKYKGALNMNLSSGHYMDGVYTGFQKTIIENKMLETLRRIDVKPGKIAPNETSLQKLIRFQFDE